MKRHTFFTRNGDALAAALALSAWAALRAEASVVTIFSDPADGEVIRQIETPNTVSSGPITSSTMTVGTSGSPPATGFVRNAIFFFELPAGYSSSFVDISSATLTLTISSSNGTLGSVNADLWGLGFQTGTTISPSWFYSSNAVDPGAGVGVASRTRVANNMLSGAIAGGMTRTAIGATLETFLESLYDAGAVPGQYAVFRLNQEPDGSATGVRRWFINSGDASTTSIRPTLTMDIVVTPEPSSLALLCIGGAFVLRRRR